MLAALSTQLTVAVRRSAFKVVRKMVSPEQEREPEVEALAIA